MRLNRVELFYAFVASIGSESRRYLRGKGGHMLDVCMQRWLATAVDLGLATCKGATDCSQAPCKGAAARRGSNLQGAATYGHDRLHPACRGGRQRLARKGQLVAANPQGAAARGQPCHRQGLGRQLQAWSPLGRVAVGRKEQQPPA
ncbi:hypothetical protein BHM03_00059868 [Ensete ventricosum]|nr:hypothetical protein BHM03_00059868 [Ensete ventricosum]